MAALTPALQTISITTSLLASGGIATLSLFDVPILQAQSASHSLPSIRWLFSRGSHIFPTAALVSGIGFSLLATRTLPQESGTLLQILKSALSVPKFNGYITAALLCVSIAPVTQLGMISTNFELIKMNEGKGGARSAASVKASKDFTPGERSAEESVAGKGEGPELLDLSGPLNKTPGKSSQAEDEKVRKLLDTFARLNMIRAVLIGFGGIVGLISTLG